MFRLDSIRLDFGSDIGAMYIRIGDTRDTEACFVSCWRPKADQGDFDEQSIGLIMPREGRALERASSSKQEQVKWFQRSVVRFRRAREVVLSRREVKAQLTYEELPDFEHSIVRRAVKGRGCVR
jgi:hypothetical protein